MLAKSLLEGYSFGSVQGSKYSAKDGANRIAMESAMELRDIYESTFYKIDALELTAYTASMESADQSVQEGIGESIKKTASSAWKKIKEWFIKLKNKVMEWFDNVKRHINAMLLSGKDFAKKYEKQIKKLDLNGYKFEEVPDFQHTKIDKFNVGKQDVIKEAKEAGDSVKNSFIDVEDTWDEGGDKLFTEEDRDDMMKDSIKIFKNMLPDGMGVEDFNTEGITNATYAELLGGSYSVNSKPQYVSYTVDIDFVIKTLLGADSYTNSISSLKSTVKSSFDSIINELNTIENRNKNKNYPNYTGLLNKISGVYSKMQSCLNAQITGTNKAQTTRLAVFKKIVTNAFAYDRKKKAAKK